MNFDPIGDSTRANNGMTRRCFIKRTSGSILITTLALHAFRNESYADPTATAVLSTTYTYNGPAVSLGNFPNLGAVASALEAFGGIPATPPATITVTNNSSVYYPYTQQVVPLDPNTFTSYGVTPMMRVDGSYDVGVGTSAQWIVTHHKIVYK